MHGLDPWLCHEIPANLRRKILDEPLLAELFEIGRGVDPRVLQVHEARSLSAAIIDDAQSSKLARAEGYGSMLHVRSTFTFPSR